jgi:N-6 DNA Methylase
MSIARHHAEWLSLVPVSGPFLSLPVLMETFNTGLEPHDPDQSRLLRQEYDNWQASFEKRNADPAPHQQWIKFVLTKTLELDDWVLAEGQKIPQMLQVEVPEHQELLRPSIVLIDPTTRNPRLLVRTYPRSQELSSYVVNSPWKASPDTRMTELLHATGVRLGLVTNGEHWMLVDAPKGGTTGYASWYASLWLEEPITLRAFRSLLSASRFFNVPDDQTLEALLTKSASNQQEVTDQLGYQVRQAVEVLIHEIAKIEHEPEIDADLRKLIADILEAVLYESALTVMMRLVILFCAEERGLIPTKPFPVYEQNYSVSTISKQLRELADQHDEALLERRYDAWPRLLAAFRAVYGGLQHDDVHIPAYGGSLFNPDRFPFLEGRKKGTSWRDTEAHPIPVSNRTVLHLLEALQLLQMKVPGGGPAEARRLSFRALDIEQIGHVYEGLLDHTAKRASEPFLGVAGTRDKEPELPLAELEKLLAKGEADLVKFLKEETGKSENAIRKALKAEIDPQDATRFRTVCQGDDSLWKRVMPLAGLVRLDDNGYPVVIPKGHVFVTAGTDRRSSGTHYTPRELTDPIVRYTLEPLVYVGPAEGKPKNEWKLKSAKELLNLKICDMACGSGAFLVQADRYMSERLLEAWDAVKQANHSTPGITPEGTPSTGKANESLIPDDPAERKTYAMRIIAQRCLYGVDKNPLAAEMTKLSLWLLTMAKDKPFEFLDHSIRCGDSLVGIHSIEQLRKFNLDGKGEDNRLFLGFLDERIKEAIALRRQITEMQANTVEDVEAQDRMLSEADEKIERLKCAADMLIAAEFTPGSTAGKRAARDNAAIKVAVHFHDSDLATFRREAQKALNYQVTFHWPLEFPEVMVERGGFDAFVGNPPFLGGSQLSEMLGGPSYQEWLKNSHKGAFGNADLSAYFFRRAFSLFGAASTFGLLATKTISEGSSRTTGLQSIIEAGGHIYRANKVHKWPGTASVLVAIVHVASTKSVISGSAVLDGREVEVIDSRLEANRELLDPAVLQENELFAFKGTDLGSSGFILSADEFTSLAEEKKNLDCLRPFLGGEELNTSPTQANTRFVVYFGSQGLAFAEQYPTLLELVRTRVKPMRDRGKDHGPGNHGKKYWWQYTLRRDPLYKAIGTLSRCLVTAVTTQHLSFSFQPVRQVFTHSLVVIAFDRFGPFACLQSNLHYCWACLHSSWMGLTLRYSVQDALQTFPFPGGFEADPHLEQTGSDYYTLRAETMVRNCEGLTKTYNRFHNPDDTSADIQYLRQLHIEMDKAVAAAAAYGWTDLELGHSFHETKQGVRYTISEPARREVLQRLLKLNHERYAEEVKQGLHCKKGAAKNAAPKKTASTSAKEGKAFFNMEEDDG